MHICSFLWHFCFTYFFIPYPNGHEWLELECSGAHTCGTPLNNAIKQNMGGTITCRTNLFHHSQPNQNIHILATRTTIMADHRKLRRSHLKNIRERERVVFVNKAFLMLRACLPQMRARKRRVSKLKLLRAAVEYIHSLEQKLTNLN